jgi:hypothetical protein
MWNWFRQGHYRLQDQEKGASWTGEHHHDSENKQTKTRITWEVNLNIKAVQHMHEYSIYSEVSKSSRLGKQNDNTTVNKLSK